MLPSKVSRIRLTVATPKALFKGLLYWAFVAALTALAAALAIAVVPRLFGYQTLVVQGASMGDSIPIGSVVFARWTAAEDLNVGDVILIRYAETNHGPAPQHIEESHHGPATPHIHRVISLEEEGGQILAGTKGDANETADPNLHILPDRIPIAAYTLPYLGYLVAFIGTPLGWALLVGLPATVLCLVTLKDIWAPEEGAVAKPGGA